MDSPLLVARRIAALFSRNRLDEELREEMEDHIQRRRTALVAEGMDPADADAAARRMFGNATVLRERTRAMWGFPRVESVVQDVRYGLRSLRRSPVFTAVAVLSIAGGLAAGTAIFAIMNAIVYRSIGVGDGQHLYRIFTSDHSGTSLYSSSSYADFEAFRTASGVIASACATEGVRANLVVSGTPSMHHGEIVSPGCFTALQLAPPLGRYFTEDADASAVGVVIGHSLWLRRFDGDSSVIGRTIQLNGMPVTVVAVAPSGFAGTSLDAGAEFWAPVDVAPVVFPSEVLRDRRQRMFSIYARLRDGVGREQAEAGLTVVAAQLRMLDSATWSTAAGGTRTVTVMRETEARFAGAPTGAVAGIFVSVIAAVGAIVAIACLNLATMLLARGATRAKEISIRLAIGASRGRVLRQLATESLIIAAIGAALALATVWLGVRLFEAFRPPIVPAFDLAIDWRVLAFAIALAIVAALLFGLAPATHTLRLALAEGLKGGLVATRVRRMRVSAREALIVLQVAVSIALLLVSALFVRARAGGETLSPGFSATNVAVVPAHLDAVPEAEVGAVTERLLEAAATVPGVGQVSLAGIVPMSGSSIGLEAAVDGAPARSFLGNVIAPGYFATLEIPIRSGRDFDQRDRTGGAPTAIVSETFARTVWGTPNVVGREFLKAGRRVTVVGVVADTRYRSLSEPFQPVLYLPIGQVASTRFLIHARVRDGQTLAVLDAAVRAVDRRAAIEAAMPLRAQIDRAMAGERVTQWIGGIVGIIQLGLAVMALWGLVAYAVERRTAEMGVRLALGATPSSLVRLAMRPAGIAIIAGVAIGCILGATVARVVQSASVALAPLDLVAVIPVAAMFTVVAMASAWWPARRAGLADPAASLRRE